MVQFICSPGEDVDMQVEFRLNGSKICLITIKTHFVKGLLMTS